MLNLYMVELIKMRQKLRSLFIYYSNSNQNIASKKGSMVFQTFNQKTDFTKQRDPSVGIRKCLIILIENAFS